jgi:hypothetical protein
MRFARVRSSSVKSAAVYTHALLAPTAAADRENVGYFRPGKDGSAGSVRESRHTIDYCMYAGAGLSVSEILGMPTAEDLGEARAPSFTYPSDHFSLQVHFSLQ